MNRSFGMLSGRLGRLSPITTRMGAAGLAVLLSSLALTQAARADELLAAQSMLFNGTESETVSLNAPTAGTIDVTLTDLGWPDKMSSLSFSASTASTDLASTQISPTTYQFSASGAGSFYAHISGVAGVSKIAGLPNFGLFGMQAMFTPGVTNVPLPPGIWLLATGLFALVGLKRVRKPAAPAGLLSAPAF